MSTAQARQTDVVNQTIKRAAALQFLVLTNDRASKLREKARGFRLWLVSIAETDSITLQVELLRLGKDAAAVKQQ